MLDDLLVSKTLVIAPLRVARDTWPAEITKWDYLSDLDISVIVGTAEDRTAALNSRLISGSTARPSLCKRTTIP